MISFEEFQKIDLRVAKIIKAEKIEGSEKLFLLVPEKDVPPGAGVK